MQHTPNESSPNHLDITHDIKSLTLGKHEQYGPCVFVDNTAATARIALFGAHLLSFIPKHDQRDRLWLSDKAIFDNKTPIRGGVPICWPWFGPSKRNSEHPNHGFARTQNWTLASINEVANANGDIIETHLQFLPENLGMYDVPEQLTVAIEFVVGEYCEVKVVTHNLTKQRVPLSQAIHSYFKVDDINQVEIQGIHQDYYNKLDDSMNNRCPMPYRILDETDRVHFLSQHKQHSENEHHIVIDDHNALINIYQLGHNSTVVWNPWKQNSIKMKDMTDKGFKTMLCVEAASEPEIILAPGQQHVLSQRFR